MAERLSERCRPTVLDRELAELAGANQAAWGRTWLLVAGAAVAAFVGILALEAATEAGFGLGFGCMGLVFGGIAVYALVKRQQRTQQKLAFARGLCQGLLDDFHPRSKVSIDLDLGDYAQARNKYWSGRSQHGNPKYKYADRWCTLKFRLADGSRVRLVKKADVKTKKGSIMRYKRQLYVHVTPNPERYGAGPWDVSVLDGLVQTAVAHRFHDPPEELRVRASAATGSTIDLKITQLDAEILPDEVVALLDATLSAVHLHRLDVRE